MVQKLLSTLITFGIFFILLFVYTKLAGPIPFSVNSITTNKSTTFDVTGEGKAEVKPDSAQVSAGVSSTGATVEQVQNQMNTIINRVSVAVKQLGIEDKDIQTTNYNINPIYDYTGGRQNITGYSANTNLTIKVRDITKLDLVIDTATKMGATNVNNLGFDSENKQAAEDEARKLAVADAKKKAEMIAGSVGFRLGNIVNYSEGSGDFGPIPLRANIGGGEAKTSIEPGTNEVRITVVLSYEVR